MTRPIRRTLDFVERAMAGVRWCEVDDQDELFRDCPDEAERVRTGTRSGGDDPDEVDQPHMARARSCGGNYWGATADDNGGILGPTRLRVVPGQ